MDEVITNTETKYVLNNNNNKENVEEEVLAKSPSMSLLETSGDQSILQHVLMASSSSKLSNGDSSFKEAGTGEDQHVDPMYNTAAPAVSNGDQIQGDNESMTVEVNESGVDENGDQDNPDGNGSDVEAGAASARSSRPASSKSHLSVLSNASKHSSKASSRQDSPSPSKATSASEMLFGLFNGSSRRSSQGSGDAKSPSSHHSSRRSSHRSTTHESEAEKSSRHSSARSGVSHHTTRTASRASHKSTADDEEDGGGDTLVAPSQKTSRSASAASQKSPEVSHHSDVEDKEDDKEEEEERETSAELAAGAAAAAAGTAAMSALVYKKVRKGVPNYLQNVRSKIHDTFTANINYNRHGHPHETDVDSGVDETTQNGSPNKGSGASSSNASRIPKKTPPATPTRGAVTRSRTQKPGHRPPVRSKSVPKPFTSYIMSTPTPPPEPPVKKIPMNKIKVGMTSSPNLKVVRSKVGSLQNASHKPGGGEIKIEHRKLDWKAEARTKALNEGYTPKGGDKKIENRKLDWNSGSRVGSLDNAKHRPGGGAKRIESQRLTWKGESKVGSVDNIKHKPGGGNIKSRKGREGFANKRWNSTGNVGGGNIPGYMRPIGYKKQMQEEQHEEPEEEAKEEEEDHVEKGETDKEETEKEESDHEEEDKEETDKEGGETEKEEGGETEKEEGGETEKEEGGETEKEDGGETEKEGETDKEEEKEEEEVNESEVEAEEANETSAVPSELVSKAGSRAATAFRKAEKLDDDLVRITIRGRPVVLRIPPAYRDTWDVEDGEDEPDVSYELEWAYGYKPAINNIHYLPSSGEILYPVAAVAILYNLESHTQRHYTSHTNDIECLAIHPSAPLVASGQAEGHDEESSTIQKAHVQIWNYVDVTHLLTVGLDVYESGISGVAWSGGDQSLLATIDSDPKPNLHIWSGLEDGEPSLVAQASAHSDTVASVCFYPDKPNFLVTTGKSHVSMWTLNLDPGEDEELLDKKQGLFTRKIPRPKMVTCAAFARSGEVLTGDSDGNVMVWRGVKVVRVLKGAHAGAVGDIAVMDADGCFVSGGRDDGALVVFNDAYELIGAGAVLPESLGGVQRLVTRAYGDGHFHMYIGTTTGSIADATFSVTSSSTDVDMEVEVLVQGHGGEVRGLAASGDQFLSCAADKNVILWDAVGHTAKWVETVRAPLHCVALSSDGSKFAVAGDEGYFYLTNLEERSLVKARIGEEQIACMAFAPDGSKLAFGSHDNNIYLLDVDEDNHIDEQTIEYTKLTGHTSHVTHIDWSLDGNSLRSNSSDLELLYWTVVDQLTDGEAIDAIEGWESQNCTLTFETMAIWPQQADGTDVNACTAQTDTLAVADDFGRVRLYKYPAVHMDVVSKELLGHSAHVTDVTFLGNEGRLVSAGGREASILQWRPALSSTDD